MVELASYTNSKDEMVQNSGTKSSHMSWLSDARTWDKQSLAELGPGAALLPGASAHAPAECGQEKHVNVSPAPVSHC